MSLIIGGLFAGIITGMGIGGGAILIPVLLHLGFEQKIAQGMNLLYFIPTSIIAVILHKKNGNIETKNLNKTIGFGIIGALVGAFIAMNMDPNLLKKIFSFFLILMGLREIWSMRQAENETTNHSNYTKIYDVKGNNATGIPVHEFELLQIEFKHASIDEKINMYVHATGLSQAQYKVLLRQFPMAALNKLESALI